MYMEEINKLATEVIDVLCTKDAFLANWQEDAIFRSVQEVLERDCGEGYEHQHG